MGSVEKINARYHRLDIQGLRAFAVVAVIAFHAGLPVPGGFVGVDVFFVISGFVIASMLIRQRESGHKLSLPGFYWKRFKRLTPALATMLTVCLLVSIPILTPFGAQQAAADTAVAAMVLVANLAIARTTGDYFATSAEANLFLNTWSLSVEEQFYLLFPALLVAAWAFAGRRGLWRTVTSALLVVLLCASFLLAWLGSTGYSLERYFWLLGFYSPLTRVWEFAAGALLALVTTRGLRSSNPWQASTLGLLGVLGLVCSLWLIKPSTPYPGPWTLLPVTATVAVILAGSFNSENVAGRLFAWKPATAVGDYSYSLYLWHWPIIVLAVSIWGDALTVTVCAVVVAVVPSVLAYRLIERPLHFASITVAWKRWVLVAMVVTVPLGVALLVKAGANSLWGLHIADRPVFGGGSYGLAYCMKYARIDTASPLLDPKCVLGAVDSPDTIYLLGDSQAAQWTEGLDRVGQDRDVKVMVGTAPGCPFLDIYLAGPSGVGPDDQACRESYESNMSLMKTLPPGNVFLGQSIGYWTDTTRRIDHRGTALDESSENWESLAAGLAATVEELQGSGHQVFIILPTIDLGQSHAATLPGSCSTWMLIRDECFTPTETRGLDTSQITARTEVRSAAMTLGLPVIDLLPQQCPNGLCGLWSGDIPVYSDSSHVSADFSDATSRSFEKALGMN